jgi:hypothetical protein
MRTGPHPVMRMLAQRLPLTLLLDLRRPDGPDSQVLFLIEEPHEPAPERQAAVAH